jgi:hypothetical protein
MVARGCCVCVVRGRCPASSMAGGAWGSTPQWAGRGWRQFDASSRCALARGLEPDAMTADTHSHRTSATVTVHTSHDSFIGLKRGAALWSLTAVVAETGGRQRCHESADPTAVMHI